jgi:hypothetical protein
MVWNILIILIFHLDPLGRYRLFPSLIDHDDNLVVAVVLVVDIQLLREDYQE